MTEVPEPVEGELLTVEADRAPLLIAVGAAAVSVVAFVLSLIALLTT